jgi:hypothetical protein
MCKQAYQMKEAWKNVPQAEQSRQKCKCESISHRAMAGQCKWQSGKRKSHGIKRTVALTAVKFSCQKSKSKFTCP